MADTDVDVIPAIAFNNQLSYEVIIYDSYDYSEDDDDDDDGSSGASPATATTGTNDKPDSQAYFATLTPIGKVPAGATVSLQPIHDSSIFVVESASDNKPVKRLTALCFDEITSFSIVEDDEAIMTTTFQFIYFLLNNPNSKLTVAFNQVLNNPTDDLADDMDNFFKTEMPYSHCYFEDYMMAMAYTAKHPFTPNPSQPPGTYSLKTICTLMGFQWPSFLPDIFVTNFTCTTKDKRLVLSFEVDISTLTFETPQIAANVLIIVGGIKLVKAQLLFNYEIGLGIFGTRLNILLNELAIPVGDNKTLSVKKPGISIDINPLFKFVVFTMKATFPFNINGKSFDALASFAIDNEEAAIGVDIQGDNSSLPAPPGIKGLHFDEFGVGMGLFFKPPGFALGLLGKFHIGEPTGGNIVSLNDDTFALVCEYVGEVIKPKYAAFYVPKLSLNEVVELFTNANPHIDVPVTFSDLSFHWSDSIMDAVVLPDGTLSNGGYGFSAAVDIFSFGFYGEANLDINTGLTANVQVSPLSLGNVFKLSGDGKGYSMKVDQNGNPIPNNFVPKTQVEKDAVANATNKQIVTAGGPSLIINTLSMPILHLNAKASLFEIIERSIEADINKDVIKFILDFGGVLTEQMTCQLSDFHNFYGGFKFGIDRSFSLPTIAGVSLGAIHIDAIADAHITINTSLTDVLLKIGGSFEFEGRTRQFGDFSADIHIKKITDVIEAIFKNIEEFAVQIFDDFVHDVEKWVGAAKRGLLSAYHQISDVLKNAFNKSANEVTSIMKNAGYEAHQIASEVKDAYNATVQEIAASMKYAGYVASDIASEARSLYNLADSDVASVLKTAGYAATEVADAVRNVFNLSVQVVKSVMQKAGYLAQEISSAMIHTVPPLPEIVLDLKIEDGMSVSDINNLLQSQGLAADQVKACFESLGCEFAAFCQQHLE